MTEIGPEEARATAAEAFLFGYPLVLMDLTGAVMTNVPSASEGNAPINQFSHRRAFPDGSFTAVVSPNADTLYSTAVLDLASEPIVLATPASAGRYYLMPLLSAWTDVFARPGRARPATVPATSPSPARIGTKSFRPTCRRFARRPRWRG